MLSFDVTFGREQSVDHIADRHDGVGYLLGRAGVNKGHPAPEDTLFGFCRGRLFRIGGRAVVAGRQESGFCHRVGLLKSMGLSVFGPRIS